MSLKGQTFLTSIYFQVLDNLVLVWGCDGINVSEVSPQCSQQENVLLDFTGPLTSRVHLSISYVHNARETCLGKKNSFSIILPASISHTAEHFKSYALEGSSLCLKPE